MPYKLLATPEFENDYKKLPKEVAVRIDEKLDTLAAHPE